jgi:hypothetical protein
MTRQKSQKQSTRNDVKPLKLSYLESLLEVL